MECSGFVNWALRNGRFGLGDWTTHMFSKNGFCYKDNTVARNYHCKALVNHTIDRTSSCKAMEVVDGYTTKCKSLENKSWGNSISNIYNTYDSAYLKLKKLKDSDFVQLDGQKKSTIKDALKNAKAGDLLWRGTYINKSKGTFKNGHIAMIIGFERDSDGYPTKIYIGEAVKKAGNTLTKFSLDGFFDNSRWVDTQNEHNEASYLVKMDNVYNYFDNDTENPNDSKLAKTNPCKGKKGGNCYKYSDKYNSVFNGIIPANY